MRKIRRNSSRRRRRGTRRREKKKGRNEGREIRGGRKSGFSLVGSEKLSSLEIYASTSILSSKVYLCESSLTKMLDA